MTDNPKDPNPPPTAGEIALMNLGDGGANIPVQIQELITALQMRKALEGIVSDFARGRGYHSAPSSMLPPEPSRPAPSRSKAINGWLPEAAIESPPGQRYIAAMTPITDPLSEKLKEAMAKLKEGKSES